MRTCTESPPLRNLESGLFKIRGPLRQLTFGGAFRRLALFSVRDVFIVRAKVEPGGDEHECL